MDLGEHPFLERLVNALVAEWPEHAGYLATTMGERTPRVLRTSNEAAGLALRLADGPLGGLAKVCQDYRYVCQDLILAEELYFRRHGRYRLGSFDEANRLYYANKPLMERYMNGLLMSTILWSNHANAVDLYVHDFLPTLPAGADLLEVGPGHGLLIALALRAPGIASVTGWDVSATSIAATREALAAMDPQAMPHLVRQDVFEAETADAAFDCIVLNEVLEHLERPLDALVGLRACLRPGGRIWINMPANSPAPDHLYLLTEPEEVQALLEAAGFAVTESHFYPMTGATLERARRHRLTINAVAIGRLPDNG